MADQAADHELALLRAGLAAAREELAEARVENERLRSILDVDAHQHAWEPTLFAQPGIVPPSGVDRSSPPDEKVALYRSLFRGRDDVFARRWDNPTTRKSGWGPAISGRSRKDYLPLTHEAIAAHLEGKVAAGLYPLMPNDRCWLLACDFDKRSWVLDALAFLHACRDSGVPAAMERSRSGLGAHVWIFFSEAVAAASARALGAALLRQAMTARVELDLASYDRMFPSQDFMPKGSFGNLIALPLQGECRQRGTTVFLDPATLEPWPDQWSFLSSVARFSPTALNALVDALHPVVVGPDASTWFRPSAANEPPVPEVVHGRLDGMVSLDRIGLPPSLVASLKHMAAVANPVFYERQALRLSTWATPQFFRCYEEEVDRLRLPRGLLDRARSVVESAGSRLCLVDDRPNPAHIDLTFEGTLTPLQQAAVEALAQHELGFLVAPTGTGKTVMACALIARHSVPTVVLVDRKPLADQWRARLAKHLGLEGRSVGQIGGGRHRRSGIVDITMVQSLTRRPEPEALLADYGLVVVDECHHVPAQSFEAAVKRAPARRWLGLTATPYRRDKLEAIIPMQCGPVRHEIRRGQTEAAALRHELVVHETLSEPGLAPDAPIQQTFREIVNDHERTGQICDDVIAALDAGRNCLVLSQWTEHLDYLCAGLLERGRYPLLLKGGMTKKDRTDVMRQLDATSDIGGLLLVASGSYLGEGFDCPQLDTLFLTFPIRFRGRVEQYVGRLMRTHDRKHSVEVHDYVDVLVPMLRRMHARRLPTFAALGFPVPRQRR